MTLSMVEVSGSKTAERRAKNRRAQAYLGGTIDQLRLERE